MRKKNSDKFTNHVLKFIEQFSLIRKDDRVIVAVSGGVDSVVLLAVLHRLYQQGFFLELRVVSFDHQLRSQSKQEIDLVKNYAKLYGLKCEIITLKFDQSGNIEFNARIAREEVYQRYIVQGYKVAVAHHIDDAYEWYLLQQFKSSTPCLGIPVRRSGIIRPFLCVTKELIYNYALSRGLNYYEDESNQSSVFERNYLRNEIIPKIKVRFPQYLKHFVLQMNRRIVPQSNEIVKRVADQLGGVTLFFPSQLDNLNIIREDIFRVITTLSQKKRGTLALEIEKLLMAYRHFKRGPMSFAGGVKCIITRGALYFFVPAKLQSVGLSKTIKLDSFTQLAEAGVVKLDSVRLAKVCRLLQHEIEWPNEDLRREKLFLVADIYTHLKIRKTLRLDQLIGCNLQFVRLI